MSHRIRLLALVCGQLAAGVRAQVWTRDPAFHPALGNDAPALGSTRFVPPADGRVLAFGPFMHLENGAIPARGVAYLHADGTPDRTFDAAVDATQSIRAAVPLHDGRVLAVRRKADGTPALVRSLVPTPQGHRR